MKEPAPELPSLLCAAVSRPATVGTSGAALALSVHCIMVRQGFSVAEDPDLVGKRTRRSSYMPPFDWQAAGPSEWNFEYSMQCKRHAFKLVVALHEKTGRVFVHASEDGNPNNIQVLGLQLENYVIPNNAALKTEDWSKILVLENEHKLYELVNTYIVRPLIDNAEELMEPYETVHGGHHLLSAEPSKHGWMPHGAARLYLGAGVTVLVVAVAVTLALRQHPARAVQPRR